MVQDAAAYTMDLTLSLSRTLSGSVKPMITQCSIRHLYALPSSPQKENIIAAAKSMERRRCNHHTLEQPLTTFECLSSVIDPKSTHTDQDLVNKFNYVVAVQNEDLRRWCRNVRGVPIIYVKRSVMVMEPMATGSTGVREGRERGKFKSGLRQDDGSATGKWKRQDGLGEVIQFEDGRMVATNDGEAKKKKRRRGPKEPNPLSVKRPKRKEAEDYQGTTEGHKQEHEDSDVPQEVDVVNIRAAEDGEPKLARKRRRKHKPKSVIALSSEEINRE